MQTSRFQLGLMATLALGLGFSLASSDAVGYPAGSVSMGANPVLSVGGVVSSTTDDLFTAPADQDVVVTDVWVSMGQEKEAARRRRLFADYQVTETLMACAQHDAILLHCLPAHRGDEVTAELIDGPQSLAWEEAENRLYAQSALLDRLFAAPKP